METGEIKEAIVALEQADEVIRFRLRLGSLELGERHSCEEARELLQKAITKLTPHEK